MRLRGLGYLDDLAYARLLARRAVERRGAGPARLRQVLAARGLPAALAAAVVREAFAGRDEGAAAEAAGRRRLSALRGLAPAVARRRLAGYLARRGYGAAAIARALRALLGGAGGEGTDEADA